tara:strand:+ start:804 stop:989 length:186 start_codon:yes stop_codon:yes gene_type:complete
MMVEAWCDIEVLATKWLLDSEAPVTYTQETGIESFLLIFICFIHHFLKNIHENQKISPKKR